MAPKKAVEKKAQKSVEPKKTFAEVFAEIEEKPSVEFTVSLRARCLSRQLHKLNISYQWYYFTITC